MRYVSTRGESPSIGFLDAVLAGLAPDGGLYVPERWPTFTRKRSPPSPASPTPRWPPR
jgi:threonine synthase